MYEGKYSCVSLKGGVCFQKSVTINPMLALYCVYQKKRILTHINSVSERENLKHFI